MSEWEIHVHVDDEQTARNMMEELNQEGFGVTLYKAETVTRTDMRLQYAVLPKKKKEVNDTGRGTSRGA